MRNVHVIILFVSDCCQGSKTWWFVFVHCEVSIDTYDYFNILTDNRYKFQVCECWCAWRNTLQVSEQRGRFMSSGLVLLLWQLSEYSYKNERIWYCWECGVSIFCTYASKLFEWRIIFVSQPVYLIHVFFCCLIVLFSQVVTSLLLNCFICLLLTTRWHLVWISVDRFSFLTNSSAPPQILLPSCMPIISSDQFSFFTYKKKGSDFVCDNLLSLCHNYEKSWTNAYGIPECLVLSSLLLVLSLFTIPIFFVESWRQLF